MLYDYFITFSHISPKFKEFQILIKKKRNTNKQKKKTTEKSCLDMKCTSQFDNTDNPIIISDSLVCNFLYLMLLILKCIISSSLYGNVILDMAGVRGHRWSLSRPHRSLLPDSAVSTKLTFVFRTDMDAATDAPVAACLLLLHLVLLPRVWSDHADQIAQWYSKTSVHSNLWLAWAKMGTNVFLCPRKKPTVGVGYASVCVCVSQS